MDFKTFSNNSDCNKSTKNTYQNEKDVYDAVDKLKGKSEGELLSDLMGEAARLKREGKFNPSELEAVYDTAKGMMNSITKSTEIIIIILKTRFKTQLITLKIIWELAIPQMTTIMFLANQGMALQPKVKQLRFQSAEMVII